MHSFNQYLSSASHVLLLALLCSSFAFTFPSISYAATESSKVSTDIFISPEGDAQVEHRIEIVGDWSDNYLAELTVHIDGQYPSNVEASMSGKPKLDITAKQVQGRTSIQIPLDPSISAQQTRYSVYIRYLVEHIVQVQSQSAIYSYQPIQLDLPQLEQETHLYVPSDYPELHYAQPMVPRKYPTQEGFLYTITHSQEQNLAFFFGQEQSHQVVIQKKLRNYFPWPSTQKVVIPPDTAYQHVVIDTVSRIPKAIKTNTYGNRFASITLDPFESTMFEATFIVFVRPIRASGQDTEAIAAQLQTKAPWYLEPTQVSSKTIQEAFQHTLDQLQYGVLTTSLTDISRNNASEILQSTASAMCLDYVDVLIATARHLGIPSRAVYGYAHSPETKQYTEQTKNTVLHAWAEYYNRQSRQWLALDPTWADTNNNLHYFEHLDYAHIALAYSQDSAEIPLGYDLLEIKPTHEDFAQLANEVAEWQVSIAPNLASLLGLQNQLQVTVSHSNKSLMQAQIFKVMDKENDILIQSNLPSIEAYQAYTFALTIPKHLIWQESWYSSIGDKRYEIRNPYASYKHYLFALSFGLGFTATFGLIYLTRCILVFRRT